MTLLAQEWGRLWPVLTVVAPLRITAFDGGVIDLAELRGQGVVRAVVMGPIVAESALLRRIDAIRP